MEINSVKNLEFPENTFHMGEDTEELCLLIGKGDKNFNVMIDDDMMGIRDLTILDRYCIEQEKMIALNVFIPYYACTGGLLSYLGKSKYVIGVTTNMPFKLAECGVIFSPHTKFSLGGHYKMAEPSDLIMWFNSYSLRRCLKNLPYEEFDKFAITAIEILRKEAELKRSEEEK